MNKITRHLPVLLSVLVAGAPALTQTKPFSIKGFTVGESTLQEFKAQFHHCADNCTATALRKYGSSRYGPFCSDTESGAAVDSQGKFIQNVPAYTQAGLVMCSPYFPFEEQRGPLFTIADIPISTQFNFYQDKLYRISGTFLASRFTAMQEALTGKYGEPASTTSVEYQNAFGARFSGSVVTWDNGVSTISLRQYAGGSTDFSGFLMENKPLATQAEEAKPKHTSKDL